ncbi:uncharacterized protein LOC117604519 [Osmia lignaria lignaria]|uniref:uncharacterized protein LOC117604519 n=1 Tax=Osmia lignaria lignaria TaxID=1437193 RepID=UPI00402B5224
MDQYPGRVQSVFGDYHTSTMIDHGFSNRTIKTSYPSATDTADQESFTLKQNENLRICQALLLSTCMLLMSYHSVRYGRTEYSILANGKITQGYAHKAVVTLSLGYSISYSVISFLAIGMLAYSIVTKRPRWSIPSIILYLIDLVYDVSGAFIVIWLLFSNLPTSMAFSYAFGTILLILGEVWIWMGVLRLYEQRTFK